MNNQDILDSIWRIDDKYPTCVITDGISSIEAACLPDDYTVPPLDLIDCNSEATARRVVASVNACSGLSVSLLEHVAANGGMIRIGKKRDDAERQRDQLLAALEGMLPAVADAMTWFNQEGWGYADVAEENMDAALERAYSAIFDVTGRQLRPAKYISFTGGACPVDPSSHVEVCYYTSCEKHISNAGDINWSRVMAYRIM